MAKAVATNPQNQVVAIGEQRPNAIKIPNIKQMWYKKPREAGDKTHPYIRGFEANIRRGQTIISVLQALSQKGFIPDVICAHSGWGETLFLKDYFPHVPIIGYFEFYYHGKGADVGFDPEYPSSLDGLARVRTKNATNLLSLEACDHGIAPTLWQKQQFPEIFHNKIKVIHEGINTDIVKENPHIRLHLKTAGVTLTKSDEVITFVNRNLEPYRGFHTFVRALPKILDSRPNAHVLIIGGDKVSYGKQLPQGMTYRQKYLNEVQFDPSRVHFMGQVPYNQFISVLQVSAVHVYLTYPFVLSWSMLEAMACRCCLVASATPPVMEVIEDKVNGLLVDFFDSKALVKKINEVLDHPRRFDQIRARARQTIMEKYDLQRICLPAQLKYLYKVHEDAKYLLT
ncbi:glycosyltransferase family 4 protein [Desulfocicer vacuolatum]|uniref:glycosyltransferase family 4 protein n=1 Tax=Desulfocicer vacuolatum TaxID=2298 RepID=UPI001BAEFB2D|nr:glycosyltransferase family 4 protein [Desulfocicer vacuolatum]